MSWELAERKPSGGHKLLSRGSVSDSVLKEGKKRTLSGGGKLTHWRATESELPPYSAGKFGKMPEVNRLETRGMAPRAKDPTESSPIGHDDSRIKKLRGTMLQEAL